MRGDMAEPLIFMAWEREAVRAIYRDDLGGAFERYFDTRALALTRLLEGRATSRDWCDDRATPARETCDERDRWRPARQRWPTWRSATARTARGGAGAPRTSPVGEHRPFGLVPGIASFFNVEVPSPGDAYTLNRGKVEFGEDPPFANRGALEPTARSTTSPTSSARSTSRPPASRAIRCRPTTAPSPSAGPRSTTSRSPPGARPSPRARSAPGSSRRSSATPRQNSGRRWRLPATYRRRSGGTASSRQQLHRLRQRHHLLLLEPSRRSDTVFSSASRLPTTSITGTFARECSRTL